MIRFLDYLLFDPGSGWLTWSYGERSEYFYYDPPEYQTVAPPLRRAWATLEDLRYGYWRKPRAWTYLKDPDRSADLRLHWDAI